MLSRVPEYDAALWRRDASVDRDDKKESLERVLRRRIKKVNG